MLNAGARPGRLRARPTNSTTRIDVTAGLHRLGLDGVRDAVLLVPRGYRANQPAPFVLSLHGAGGNAEAGLYPFRERADDAGLMVLSPASRGRTWDLLLGGLGPDVAFIDRALAVVFARYSVDTTRLAIAGFSDGASYALSLGLANGDLFQKIAAFSPGFAAPPATRGAPRIFVSHGDDDQVLPIEACSRRIVPKLREAGYEVSYREFTGGHTIPGKIAEAAVDWLTKSADAPTA